MFRIVLLFTCIYFIMPGSLVLAEPVVQSEQLAQLENIADKVLHAAQTGAYADALEQLNAYGDLLTNMQFKGITDAEGLNALTAAWWDAKKTFTAIRVVPRDSLAAAGKLRLATDALGHHQRPIWLQFENVMVKNLNGMEQAVKLGNLTNFKRNFSELHFRFLEIRPAMIISGDRVPIYKLDSMFAFLDSELARPAPDVPKLTEITGELRQTLPLLFKQEDRQTFLNIAGKRYPFFWTIGIGSLIIAVLVYVGWKKFKYGEPFTIVPK